MLAVHVSHCGAVHTLLLASSCLFRIRARPAPRARIHCKEYHLDQFWQSKTQKYLGESIQGGFPLDPAS